MSTPLTAINPQSSATVSASAGTGKTWLLVSRIIRLLLAGAKPDAILAITFTRKAAAEMQSRLASRLFEFAAADDAQLKQLLQQIQAPVDTQTFTAARGLYEQLLHSRQKVRASTFHSFCQDILRRFPLDAGIPPGFELLDDTSELRQEAWDSLVREATLQPDGHLAQQLDGLMDHCRGLFNTQEALFGFLEHRSDWWAYTEGQSLPVIYAVNQIEADLRIAPEADPLASLGEPSLVNHVREFTKLLGKHPTKNNLAYQAESLNALQLINNENYEPAFDTLYNVFFTQAGEPRARSESQTQAKKMGESGQARFLELHHTICDLVQEIRRQRTRLRLYQLCCLWYELGQQLLDRFQRLKVEQRVLDFADLEWKTYNLLNHSDNAHWVQYKLDQRIDHLLIDEFQDTNPTQWQLIIPLLEELAAGNHERQRSVFLVGDHKQSIYRFRRAAPELFDAAQHWLQRSLHAINQPLSTSWRSAPAIMQCVNWVFGDGPLSDYIHQFAAHDTHRKKLWGHVEVMPLIQAVGPGDKPQADSSSLRNPLLQPRSETQDTRHYEEGKLIAAKIKALMTQPAPVQSGELVRPLAYHDIMILLRHRTHAHAYEKALREALIPYAGAERGTLLNTLEAQDMVALLDTLVTPYNNLALATVLRSPLFSCSHEHLLLLAQLQQGTWLQRLQAIVSQGGDAELQRAYHLLSQWSALAGKLPVHDLLDRVYDQGNLLNRYEAAYPDHLKQQVRANLTRFLELALEVDSGRYPSIGHFLSRLKTLRDQPQNGPDETAALDASSKVQIMTIHASKGMEAPVVFLADAGNTSSSSDAYQCIVQWPAGEPRPQRFMLTPPKKQQDDVIQMLLAENQRAEAKEEANLLYVALTRAKQYLFISGCQPNRGRDLGWYGQVREQLRLHLNLEEPGEDQSIVFTSGEPPVSAAIAREAERKDSLTIAETKYLFGPFTHLQCLREIAPSYELAPPFRDNGYSVAHSDVMDEDKQIRGTVIHKLLQLLSEGTSEGDISRWIRGEYGLDIHAPACAQWLQQARDVVANPAWRFLFDATQYRKAFNEAPIMYQLNNQLNNDTVYGFIDRLVVTDNRIILVDYKTHQWQSVEHIEDLTAYYLPQIRLYQQGVSMCWPEKPVECYLLFTHQPATLKRVLLD